MPTTLPNAERARYTGRLVVMEERDGAKLGARPRALGQAADALIGPVRGVSDRRVRMKPKRGGGTLEVKATHTRSIEGRAVASEVASAVAPLSDAFGVQTKVKPQLADGGRRVE